MPIASTDIIFRYSIASGTAGNSLATAGPGSSRGRYVSTSVLPSGGMNNLFPDITGDENAAGNVDYQCVFVLNNHATLTLKSAKVWIASEVAGGATTALAVDNIAPSVLATGTVQAAEIATKDTAPTGVSAFSTATTKAAGVSIGDLGPGQVRAVWVQRTATNSPATANDGVTIRVEGDSAA